MTAEPAAIPAALQHRWLLGFDTDKLIQHEREVLVIGSGIAGITAALHASRDRSVALVTKARIAETSTWYAQGGIAGAVGEADSVELHLADTLVVGQGLCDETVVRAVVAEAPEALAELQSFGMHFDLAEGGGIALAREGGHSLPRVLHSGDTTGAAVQDALTHALRDSEHIDVFEGRFLVDLLTQDGRCRGALVLDAETGALEVFSAGSVVLATGGAGQVFRVTTNPLIATGDGVGAAWRAGAEVGDLEFVQFHPTALDHEAAPRFLVSEALRGEGAYLLDCDLERFMVGVHPLAELAPRDVVSREIEQVMARCGRDSVWLDARHLGDAFLRSRFPMIWQTCADAGYDLARDLLPVVPAAHYLIGGVRVDVDGRSSLPGLYVSGEVTASGLHGANRLASNSLLEGLVFSRRIARALYADPSPTDRLRVVAEAPAQVGSLRAADAIERLHTIADRDLRMSRTEEGLASAGREITELAEQLAAPRDAADLEAANLLTVAALIGAAARMRTESRGCHSRLDYPDRDDDRWRVRSVWRTGCEPRLESVGASNAPAH